MDAKDVNELIRLQVGMADSNISGSKKFLLKEWNFKFLLLYGGYEGRYLSLKEIADELGEPYNTIRTRLKRLRERYPDVLETVEKERQKTKKSMEGYVKHHRVIRYTDDLDDQIQEKF